MKRVHARFVSALAIIAITLTACAQPTNEPSVTPAITVQINPSATSIPTPAPRPLGNPILVDRLPAQGEELPLDKPLELIFDQPMDRRSVEQALTVRTSAGQPVSGRLTWSSDNRALFAPEQGWERETSYNVSISADARSAKGLALARPTSFVVNTIGKLAVAQTIPANGAQDVTADATITILFNRPIVPLTLLDAQADLPTPVTFNPPIPGRGQWLNTSIYLWQPSAPLQAGTAYEGRVAAGLKDTSGALLDSDYVWTFSVAAPTVKSITPNDGARSVGPRAPISITFSQKMNHESAQAAFVIEPPVRGRFRWNDERVRRDDQPAAGQSLAGEVMTFIPEEDYQRGQSYTVRIKAGARAATGNGATAGDTTIRFQVVPRPALVGSSPENGQDRASAESNVILRFNAPMSVPTLIANLAFDPPITLTNIYSYFDQFSNEFFLGISLKPSTNYRLRLGSAASDIFGATLGQDIEVRFSTGPLPPFVNIRADGLIGTYNAAVPTEVFITHRNVTRLDFRLIALSPQEFSELTGALNAYERLRSFEPDKSQVLREWSVMTKAGLNQTANYKLSLAANGGALPTGIYLLAVSAPELVALDSDFQPARHILVVNNTHIALKHNTQQGLAWVTDLNTGRPLVGVSVSFRDHTFQEIAAAQTGSGEEAGQALAVFPESYRSSQSLYALVGAPGNSGPFGIAWSQMSYGINIYDFDLPGRYEADPYFVYLITDRPIYRPGQMVFYKGIVRRYDDARYSLPADLTSVSLEIYNSQSQKILSTTATLDANGGFNGQFVLDNNALTGYYYLLTCAPRRGVAPNESSCSYYSVPFLVAAYRAPEFEVTVKLDKADYREGETINATAEASYFFGGKASGARVEWSLLAEDYTFDRYTGSGDYTFDSDDGLPRTFGFVEPIANGEGVTDGQGRFTLSLPADLSKRKRSARFTLEVSITDVNDQSVSARASTIVHKGRYYAGIAPRSYVYAANEEVVADVIAVDWFGQPQANVPLVVSFNRRQWFTVMEQDAFGALFYTSAPSDTEMLSVTLTTDAEGKATASFKPQEGGEYHILVGAAEVVSAGDSVFVSESDTYIGWRMENNDRIELKADKSSYRVGETARVLVPSPFQGATSALLTIERGGFIQRRTITLRGNSEILEIPIEASFAPNVYVSVLLVKGVDSSNPVPAYRLGYAAFSVAPEQFALNITITPDRAQYAPRDTATYELRVTDSAGNPVQAELALSLADKAVISLVEPNSAPIMQAFYGEQPLSVRTADTLNVNVDRITRSLAQTDAKGGGGGESFAAAFLPRQNFKDTAYWNAVVQTDAEGRARVQVTLPDNLTTWTMTAWAITPDTRVGQATRDVVATKPLLVRPVTPRFFVVGDTATLGAVVNNNTSNDLDVRVSLASTYLTLLGGNAIQQVSVKAGGTARVDWTVVAQDGPAAEITMTVAGGGLLDSVQPSLASAPEGGIPILRYAAPETIATAGDLDAAGRKLELIALPPRLNTGQGELTVRIDTGLGTAAASSVRAIDELPYESNDWAAARLIANLALARFGNITAEVQTEVVGKSLQRFYGQQRSDGGWAWWGDDASDPWVSAHVVLAMARAKQAGFSIDEGVFNRAHNYLNEQLKPADLLNSASEANRQAYILFVQAESERADGGRLGALFENRAKLGHDGRALLAMALAALDKQDPRIKTLLADLQSAAITSATGTAWQERTRDWTTDARSTAIIMTALARLDPQNALIPSIVRWLMAARLKSPCGCHWTTTEENEWAITALEEWVAATGEQRSAFNWRATLNDRSILSGRANPQGESAELKVAVASLLRDQANELAFERGAGEGRLYYTAYLQAYLPAESAPAINRGIVIARKYESADCTPTPEKPCPAINSAKIGQNVRVRLTIVAPNDLYYVRVVDRLPAGAEAVDTLLKTGALAPTLGGVGGWGWWYFTHSEIYDDRVAVFASYLPAGSYEYTYVIRPSIAGQFRAMPAAAEQSYFPEVFGRSEGALFTIER